MAEARRLAGPEALVGLSTHSPEQIEAACAPPARTAPTRSASARCGRRPTKEGRPGTGLGLIEYAAGEATIPWFAIGGIDAGNVSSVVAAGAERIVVVRAIRDAEDPAAPRAPARSARGRRRGAALMASRERRRAERSKRKARSVERRGRSPRVTRRGTVPPGSSSSRSPKASGRPVVTVGA